MPEGQDITIKLEFEVKVELDHLIAKHDSNWGEGERLSLIRSIRLAVGDEQ